MWIPALYLWRSVWPDKRGSLQAKRQDARRIWSCAARELVWWVSLPDLTLDHFGQKHLIKFIFDKQRLFRKSPGRGEMAVHTTTEQHAQLTNLATCWADQGQHYPHHIHSDHDLPSITPLWQENTVRKKVHEQPKVSFTIFDTSHLFSLQCSCLVTQMFCHTGQVRYTLRCRHAPGEEGVTHMWE